MNETSDQFNVYGSMRQLMGDLYNSMLGVPYPIDTQVFAYCHLPPRIRIGNSVKNQLEEEALQLHAEFE